MANSIDYDQGPRLIWVHTFAKVLRIIMLLFQRRRLSAVSDVAAESFKPARNEDHDFWINNNEQEDEHVENDVRENHVPARYPSHNKQENTVSAKLECITGQLNIINEYLTIEKESVVVASEWRIFAILLDRLFLIIYIFSLIICGVALYSKYIHNTEVFN